MMKQLGGVLGPVVTPFDPESGDVAPVSFRANVRAHLEAGLNGIVVTGSTGEAALLDEDERSRLLEWARPLVPEDRWLIAGIGGESTRITIRRAMDAGERGADAVLVVAPHYFGSAMTYEALSAHYRAVADASPIPVILYNIPKYMHFALTAPLVAELATHPRIIGIKDSSGDLKMLGGFLGAQRDTFSVLTGHGGTFYAALEMGARGGILAVALFAGPTVMELCRSFAEHERAVAGRAQERLVPLARDIVGAMGPAGVKAAMDEAGLTGGPVRSPLPPLKPQDRERVKGLMSEAGALR